MKKTAAKRVVKKRPAKRAVRSNSVEGKFMKLKNRIDGAFVGGEHQDDKSWVMGVIEEIRDGINPSKAMLLKANNLWRAYA